MPLRNAIGWLARRVRVARPRRQTSKPPVIICPYLYPHEAAEVRAKFRLDRRAGAGLEFFLWHDTERRGPERAFEFCWDQFPDRDVVLIHSDMAPLPGDTANAWYESLLGFRDRLPRAGMIACNLLYPSGEHDGVWRVQCAGGSFRDGRIDYLRGPVLGAGNEADAGVPERLLREVRAVDWVTFGGVLIRRDVIRACGPFDRRYEWAYVMDVDYSLEARLRGFRLYQVPVSLLHEESRTTRPMLQAGGDLRDAVSRNWDVFHAKWRPLAAALPPENGNEVLTSFKPALPRVSAPR
ncbi:MAG: hypothetical protein M3Y41_13425 [Pseudomonadota bacterium]|nr:hypothetical protein [Pseudomonadota bacterium]